MGSELSCFLGNSFAVSEAPVHHGGLEVDIVGHHGKESVDTSMASWESAWIDLGGEGWSLVGGSAWKVGRSCPPRRRPRMIRPALGTWGRLSCPPALRQTGMSTPQVRHI